MDQRERLINLIIAAVNGCSRHWAEVIADHLLANGVLVPPCKVGDTVYVPGKWVKEVIPFVIVRVDVYGDVVEFIDDSENVYDLEDFGKTVFLTRKAAEEKMKEEDHGC